ncbi:MAG: hypothetical protein COY75_03165 [Nitrospirae bacterium CG_4_10_14_0_8_um_filter_41_23]|nr:MAG: hypothetical protein COV68_09235 [Nitrospirae bacterium CG11_big_fil_rev_8_21_14_0_20_41_14]PIW86759.1 MAG: hypothetical protein COZ94_08790 [Nitrospirae bacterium CG_4_8_14_3_um_filter_41_47]PIY87366.1 MAG: hypothetical protein COY75_03165 [Nitrospirae bacterium CG_4_10_14_0_8_um_filter_41_23]PJA79351.1 MAG: hypothetical protein CO148_08080 [Nitrospirae bacterium CG_4_9_14_3_um_filter_41_27]
MRVQELKLIVIGLILISCMSCVTMGNIFSDDDVKKIKPGMLEEEVIAILKAEPNSRSEYPNGTYLLQWMYSYGTPVSGGGRHIAILFGPERRVIKITHQFKTGPEPLIK